MPQALGHRPQPGAVLIEDQILKPLVARNRPPIVLHEKKPPLLDRVHEVHATLLVHHPARRRSRRVRAHPNPDRLLGEHKGRGGKRQRDRHAGFEKAKHHL
jgi:hypothetical protein